MTTRSTLHIAGTGCCLMDYLYTRIDFRGAAFRKVLSRTPGDGGLRPGALVFAEDFTTFAGVPFQEWLHELTGGQPPDAENLGGPAIVALIHAAQILYDRPIHVSFHAGHGDDKTGRRMREIIAQTPVDTDGYRQVTGASPSTVVLSDPSHNAGKGERTFINTIGAANSYTPDMLEADFFNADIRLFGATALTPQLHDHLTEILRRGREHAGVNVVGTVYDFRSEQRHPEQPWPLGDRARSYPLIDMLVCDREEALRISGCHDTAEALDHFIDGGIGSVVVTHGAESLHLASRGGLFAPLPPRRLPVCQEVLHALAAGTHPTGDTTGCGDNFMGGILTSTALQMLDGKREDLDLIDACAWGAASGGFACFYPGGTLLEPTPGSKRRSVAAYYQAYLKQIR